MKLYRIGITSDDPYCFGWLEFDADIAELHGGVLYIDGKAFKASEGFHTDVQEVENG
jgi:hypothetical protein